MNDYTPGLLKIGERISKHRFKLQLSQKDLADTLGITQSSIAQIEKGQTNPSIGRLISIAKALKVGVEDLVSEKMIAPQIDFKQIFEHWEMVYKRHLTIEEKVLILTSHNIGYLKGLDGNKGEKV